MLKVTNSPTDKRKRLREALASDGLMRMPGAMSPLVAMVIEEQGFDGVYISGAVLSADLGLPDIGLTTLSEVAGRGHQIARATNLPSIIDVDTGFGEPMNIARTILTLEDLGLAGCHLEDQINPKRCGHLDGKNVVDTAEMVRKVRAAIEARRDGDFLIMARTDARAIEGLEAAIERAKAYVDAGADAIFPEAMQNAAEFEAFRKAIGVPLLANMTEFGKSELLDADTLANIGINIVIYPVTSLRLAMGAVETGLAEIRRTGTQAGIVDRMQTRARLYELIGYEDFNRFDTGIFNFKL
jgi:methylisocitrate lyase